jgi:hypothetical protein
MLLALVVALDVALIAYTRIYGAIDTSSESLGQLRLFALQCLTALLAWRRFRRAAWVAPVAWCFLLSSIALNLTAVVLLGFTGNSSPPGIPYLVPVVPLLAAQVAALLAPAVRGHVRRSA